MSLMQGTNVTVKVRFRRSSQSVPRRSVAGVVVKRPPHWLANTGTWLIAFVLLYFSAGGTFSFSDPEANTQMGAASGAGGGSAVGLMVGRFVLLGLIYVAWRWAAQVRKAAFCVPLLALLNCMGVI